jgi:hypothetical protein
LLADFAVFEDFVEESGEGAGTGTHGDLGDGEVSGEGVITLAQGLEFVGDVERSQNGYAQRIYGVAECGDGAHFGVYGLSELLDVDGVGSAEMVDLIVDFDGDGLALLRLFDLRRCGKSLVHRVSLGVN